MLSYAGGSSLLPPRPSCAVLQGWVLGPFAVGDGRAAGLAGGVSIGRTYVRCSCCRSSGTIGHHGGLCGEYPTRCASQFLSASRGVLRLMFLFVFSEGQEVELAELSQEVDSVTQSIHAPRAMFEMSSTSTFTVGPHYPGCCPVSH